MFDPKVLKLNQSITFKLHHSVALKQIPFGMSRGAKTV